MTRLRLADLTSGVGALVLGLGLGTLFAARIGAAAVVVTLVGLLVHAFGMWDKHRLEAQAPVGGNWLALTLYWSCWLVLAGIFVFLIL